jgi:alpha-glucosidase
MSTHDAVRFPTRWCRGNPRLVRCALLALLTMRGTPVLYYGDELGLPETTVPESARRDMAGRDGARTPMPWADVPGAGFTEPGVEPWLPFGDLAASSVEAQRDDAGSTLSLTRSLIRLRREVAGLRSGGYASLPAPDGVWAWRRGDRYAVAVNLGEDDAAVDGFNGTVILGTSRTRAGERLWGSMRLGPAEGALVELKP